MLTLWKNVAGSWETVKRYLYEDLDHIEKAINQRWSATFGDSNVLGTDAGGTGIKGKFTIGDLLIAVSPTKLGSLPDVAIGNVLLSGGAKLKPHYGKVDLTSMVINRLPYANFTAASADSILLGRGSLSGPGDWEEITLGTGLTMTGTVLSSSGSGSGTAYAPMSTGAEPLQIMSNGAGAVLMVGFTP